jgi:hypothetical protein
MSNTKIESTIEAWEDGLLGDSIEHAKPVDQALKQSIDDALGLQAISIRLPKSTIEAYKNIAQIHGVGYQPLMRDAIVRWAEAELKQLLAGTVESQRNRPTKPIKVYRQQAADKQAPHQPISNTNAPRQRKAA